MVIFRQSTLFSPYLDVVDCWRVELQSGLLLSPPVPVKTLQDQVTDGQPLAGCQLRGQLQRLALQLV